LNYGLGNLLNKNKEFSKNTKNYTNVKEMGTDGPGIMQGSLQMDLQAEITNICDVDLDNFLENKDDPTKNILTRKIFEKHLDEILNYIKGYEGSLIWGEQRLAYQVLGHFVLLTGVKISSNLKEKLLVATDFGHEKHLWPDFWKEDRKLILNEFREKIANHKSGKIQYFE
jgi:hypothetical protein